MKPTHDIPELLDAIHYSEREVSVILGVATKTLQGWRFRRKGPKWKRLCGVIRYNGGELKEWLRHCEGSGQSQARTRVSAQ
jgi:hypothetical protein